MAVAAIDIDVLPSRLPFQRHFVECARFCRDCNWIVQRQLYTSSLRDNKPLQWYIVFHYNDVTMSAMVSQITSITIVYSFEAQIKENTKAPRHWSLCGEFTGDRWIPRTKGSVTRKVFPFDDIIMHGEFTFAEISLQDRCIRYGAYFSNAVDEFKFVIVEQNDNPKGVVKTIVKLVCQ